VQFGKLIGICLIILGLLLISLQAWSSVFSGQLHPQHVPAAHVQQRSDAGHVPGIIGTIVMIAGFVIFGSTRRNDQDRPRNPVK
jgi:hypothetical protein